MSTGLFSHTESASSYYTKQRRNEQEDTQEWCSDLTFHVASAWNFACMELIRSLTLTQNYLLVSYSLPHSRRALSDAFSNPLCGYGKGNRRCSAHLWYLGQIWWGVSMFAILGVTRLGSKPVETAWAGLKRPRKAPVLSCFGQMFLTRREFSLLASESELLMNDSAL